MNEFNPVYVEASNLPEAWVRLIWSAFMVGRPYLIEEGSRAGQHRLSLDHATAFVSHPESRPLVELGGEGKVSPTNLEDVEKYFHEYVLNPHPPAPNEHYKYSEFLYPLSQAIVEYWKQKGTGNAHTVMRVGDPFCFTDYFKPHSNESTRKTTPCLLSIQAKVVDGKVCFHVVYRSWDLFSGFPVNNGGFQLLKEFMAHEAGLTPGPSTISCPDLHLYEEDLLAAAAWVNLSDMAQEIQNEMRLLRDAGR